MCLLLDSRINISLLDSRMSILLKFDTRLSFLLKTYVFKFKYLLLDLRVSISLNKDLNISLKI